MNRTEVWARSRSAPSVPAMAIALPLVEQTSSYSCGAAAMSSVLRYWLGDAVPPREDALRSALGTDPGRGTEIDALVGLGASSGLEAQRRVGMTITELRGILAQGRTAVLAVQAWKKTQLAWPDVWDSGHYVVLVGMDADRAYFMDPSTPDAYAFIDLPELEARWHDVDVGNRRVHGAAVVIWGVSPAYTAAPPLVQPRPLR